MILGITGKMGSGKSTAAEYIAKAHGFERVNFKDALLYEVEKCFPELLKVMAEAARYESVAEMMVAVPRPKLLRTLLQNYGSNVRRVDNIDYWVERWAETIKYKGYKNVVVDDVRFMNEALRIKMFNGRILRVNRHGLQTSSHISETEMDKIICDDEIWNDGTPAQLFDKVDLLLVKEQ